MCKKFKVPQMTLQRFVRSSLSAEKCVGLKVGRKPVLPAEIEQQLVEFLVEMDNRFYGLTRLDVKRLAYQVAEKNNIQHPFASNAAGRAWFDLFMRRHKTTITIHKPIGTSLSRANGFNKEAIDKFFDMLEAEYDKHNFAADRVYNVDETGLTVVQSKVPHVVGLKGTRQVGAITSAERGSLVTVICCMSAGGTFVPPMMIFPRKNWTDILMKGAPPGAIGRCHPSGWIQTELFTEWFEHFLSKTHPLAESPVFLALDGVVERARTNHFTIVSIPPHTSHKTQTLDKTFMGTLKTYYSEYVRQWLRHSNRPLGPYDIAELFGKAYLQCQTASIAVKGFSETGVFPCNRTVFSDADFLPSATATREGPDEDLALPSTSSVDLSVPSTSSKVCVSPYEIMPLPPLKRKTSNRGRKPSSCAVFTSSPYKKKIEESFKSKTSPKQKPPAAGKKTRKMSKAPPPVKENKKRLQFKMESDTEESNKSLSSRESDLDLPVGVKEPTEKDALCIFCGNPFSKDIHGELWIQCQLCEEWSHSECAGAEKDSYICDFCK